LLKQLDGDEIENVTDEMLEKLVNGELDGVGTIYCKSHMFTMTACTVGLSRVKITKNYKFFTKKYNIFTNDSKIIQMIPK
jgi:hypothetical protein